MNPKRDGESMQSTKAFFYRRHKAERNAYIRASPVPVYASGMELSLFRGFVNNQLFSLLANIHRVERRIRVGGCNYLPLVELHESSKRRDRCVPRTMHITKLCKVTPLSTSHDSFTRPPCLNDREFLLCNCNVSREKIHRTSFRLFAANQFYIESVFVRIGFRYICQIIFHYFLSDISHLINTHLAAQSYPDLWSNN